MFGTCNTACVGAVTITNTDQCDVYERSECGIRLLYAKCDFDFPTGAYQDDTLALAVETAITNGDIGASFELAQFEWGEPTRVEKKYRAKCKRGKSITTGRDLNARSYVATDVDSAGAAAPFWDRTYFNSVENNQAVEVRGFVTCNGLIYLFLDADGSFISNVMDTYVGYDDEVEGRCDEFKSYTVKFSKDPLQSRTLPYLDIPATASLPNLSWLFEGNPA